MHLNILLIVTVVIQWVLKLDRGAGTCTGGPHMHVPARTFCDAINQYDTLQIYRRLSFALNGTSETSNCSKWLVHGVIVITSRHHICLGSEEPRFTSQKVIVTSSGGGCFCARWRATYGLVHFQPVFDKLNIFTSHAHTCAVSKKITTRAWSTSWNFEGISRVSMQQQDFYSSYDQIPQKCPLLFTCRALFFNLA